MDVNASGTDWRSSNLRLSLRVFTRTTRIAHTQAATASPQTAEPAIRETARTRTIRITIRPLSRPCCVAKKPRSSRMPSASAYGRRGRMGDTGGVAKLEGRTCYGRDACRYRHFLSRFAQIELVMKYAEANAVIGAKSPSAMIASMHSPRFRMHNRKREGHRPMRGLPSNVPAIRAAHEKRMAG